MSTSKQNKREKKSKGVSITKVRVFVGEERRTRGVRVVIHKTCFVILL